MITENTFKKLLGLVLTALLAFVVLASSEAIAAYQKTMAECSVEIGNSLGMMNIELRERAAALVEEKQLASIIENSDKFMQTISDDFARMMDSVRQITEKTIDNANQYISPTFARAMTGSTGQRQIE